MTPEGSAARRARCESCGKRRMVYPDLDAVLTCRRCNLRFFFERVRDGRH